ncbi:hypothetical protein HU675_0038060 [Bradyrhizobium septentrionale]|uniref:hypothetical protein n=1 Tax=Bradyrhizobium septentrionale TaxID=1404411 RepID=UPI001596505C|nr:hypothetical protein [Bradyrhizobium septentrionale]UGY23694.1 hypothetical protein HU675_0038060 [Bradyrhizobium septentrionale]
MSKLDQERVDRIYEQITGERAVRGSWNVRKRDLPQNIVYIDDACRSVIAAIAAIENAAPGDDMSKLERALRTEFEFLNTLQERS